MDNTGLSQVPTPELAQKLYGACVTGDNQAASVFAAVLALRQDGGDATRKVFAINCTASGRDARSFPCIKD